MCDFKISEIFTDHMVLQRNAEISVWGKAKEGSLVSIEFCGQNHATKVINGEWNIILSPLDAGGPYDMRVICGMHEIVLNDILLGEVWVAGGQSNMEFKLISDQDAISSISLANYPEVRCYSVPRIPYPGADLVDPQAYSDKAEWRTCTPESAGDFPAVAYYFSKNIYMALGIPVGIIDCNCGATSASCWMSEKYLSKDKDIKVYLDEYNRMIEKQDPEEYERECKAYNEAVDKYNEIYNEAVQNNISGTELAEVTKQYPWPPPIGPRSALNPVNLYITMVKKIISYAIRGVIFYQGESDAHKPYLYSKLFSEMIKNWREDWKNPELPFLFVQLTSYEHNNNPEGEEWAIIREQQMKVARELPNTAMAVSIDCGDRYNIHPVCKKPVGERLALLARSIIYNQEVDCYGPIFREMKVIDSKVILYFDHVGKGLFSKGSKLTGFKICGDDKKFVDAKAEIIGFTVEVSSDEIEYPVAVRYGWANYAEVNLYNDSWLPASPFRTDNF